MKRILSYDPLNQATTWWDWDAETNESLTWTEQPVDQLIEWNKLEYNENDRDYGVLKGQNRWGTRVARIPMVIYMDWVRSGKIRDHAFLRRWLNDPENRHFRTHESRI